MKLFFSFIFFTIILASGASIAPVFSATAGTCKCRVDGGNARPIAQLTSAAECIDGSIPATETTNFELTECTWTAPNAAVVDGGTMVTGGDVFTAKQRAEIKALDKFGGRSIQQVIGLLIKSAMGILGSIALVMFIYGGVMWMTSMGNSHKEDEGKDTVMWAAIGIAVILSSYALVTYLFASIAP